MAIQFNYEDKTLEDSRRKPFAGVLENRINNSQLGARDIIINVQHKRGSGDALVYILGSSDKYPFSPLSNPPPKAVIPIDTYTDFDESKDITDRSVAHAIQNIDEFCACAVAFINAL